MKTIITTLILLLTIYIHSFACECPEYNLKDLDYQSYEWSDLIIIGNIIKTGTNYKIDVKEVLKGKTTTDIIEGMTIGENEVLNNCTFIQEQRVNTFFILKWF